MRKILYIFFIFFSFILIGNTQELTQAEVSTKKSELDSPGKIVNKVYLIFNSALYCMLGRGYKTFEFCDTKEEINPYLPIPKDQISDENNSKEKYKEEYWVTKWAGQQQDIFINSENNYKTLVIAINVINMPKLIIRTFLKKIKEYRVLGSQLSGKLTGNSVIVEYNYKR